MEMKASCQVHLNVLFISKIVEETKLIMKKLVSPYDNRPTSIADIAAGYIDKENAISGSKWWIVQIGTSCLVVVSVAETTLEKKMDTNQIRSWNYQI